MDLVIVCGFAALQAVLARVVNDKIPLPYMVRPAAESTSSEWGVCGCLLLLNANSASSSAACLLQDEVFHVAQTQTICGGDFCT